MTTQLFDWTQTPPPTNGGNGSDRLSTTGASARRTRTAEVNAYGAQIPACGRCGTRANTTARRGPQYVLQRRRRWLHAPLSDSFRKEWHDDALVVTCHGVGGPCGWRTAFDVDTDGTLTPIKGTNLIVVDDMVFPARKRGAR